LILDKKPFRALLTENTGKMDMPRRYRFTVFTSTFNRAHTLPRVYASLSRQTFKDFEWLIVDDGSTDQTASLIQQWQAAAKFPIRYVYQANQGKHIAFNRGVELAEGELFLTLDSDDACFAHALERFDHHWRSIPEERKAAFSAVTASCMDENGRLIGSRLPKEIIDSDSIEIRHRYRVTGEKWGFHRTDILRQFPFPEVGMRCWVTEGLIWRAIARKYKTRYVAEALRVYFTVTEPSFGRLTSQPVETQAPGRILYNRSVLDNDLGWFWCAPIDFARVSWSYIRNALHTGLSLPSAVMALKLPAARVLTVLAAPVGVGRYLVDCLRGKRSLRNCAIGVFSRRENGRRPILSVTLKEAPLSSI